MSGNLFQFSLRSLFTLVFGTACYCAGQFHAHAYKIESETCRVHIESLRAHLTSLEAEEVRVEGLQNTVRDYEAHLRDVQDYIRRLEKRPQQDSSTDRLRCGNQS